MEKWYLEQVSLVYSRDVKTFQNVKELEILKEEVRLIERLGKHSKRDMNQIVVKLIKSLLIELKEIGMRND
jgi:hypothetical protein